jgi:pimeloyl-ACP methyl ester carboxylesterase
MSWFQQVAHFAPTHTCVTFAHRGFAPSSALPGGPDPKDYADDLAALIDHLGLADVRLVAQSMGGWTCLGYALRLPERVRALVMADTAGSLAMTADEQAEILRLGDASDALFARGIHPAAGERMAREQPALHYLYGAINALSPDLDKADLRERLYELRTAPLESVAALRLPVLCIAGAEDVVIPPASVERLAGLIPGARFRLVPEAGHSVYFERAATFNRLLDQFLAGVDGATEGDARD